MLDRIRRRLTMGYVGILALILVLFGVVVAVSFWHQVTSSQDDRLVKKAQAEAYRQPDGGDELGSNGGVSAKTEADIAVVVVSPDGSPGGYVLDPGSSSYLLGLPDGEQARTAASTGQVVKDYLPGPDGEVRVVSVPLYNPVSGAVSSVAQAAQSRRVVWEEVGSLTLVLALVGLGALGLTTVGGLYMSRRAMRPVEDSFDRQRAFIADASHELKTPLTLIRADAEVLYRGLAEPDDRELVEDLLGETDRMSATLSDLLILARLDAGKLSVSKKPFDLATVVSETADRFGARAGAEGLRLEVHHPGEKLPARGDPERTGQILAALLDNALRFTPPGGAVKIDARTREKGRVEATVTDTGTGIPPEHLPRIFDRFYRADAGSEARTREGGGTGLGLAIARHLARAQGGDLAASNAKNGGASFTLGLPAGP